MKKTVAKKSAKKTVAKKTKKTVAKKSVKKGTKKRAKKATNTVIISQPKVGQSGNHGDFSYLVVPASKRTVTLGLRYASGLPKSSFFVQVPQMVFAIRRIRQDYVEYEHYRAAVYIDGKCYHPPFPNMFGFLVCVPDSMSSVNEHANQFFQSHFGTQDDAIFGVVEWFAPPGLQKTAKKYNSQEALSVNSSWLFEGDRWNSRNIVFRCMEQWEEISRKPNALDILSKMARQQLHPFTLAEFCQDNIRDDNGGYDDEYDEYDDE